MPSELDSHTPPSPAGTNEQPSHTIIMPNKSTKYILAFSSLENATPEEQKLTADIVILDHRALHQLGSRTREREEVVGLLYNTVIRLHRREATEGNAMLQEAERVYLQHNQTRNRIRYLLGAVVGVVTAAALAAILLRTRSFGEFVTSQRLILLFVFAGMGTITSVLTRISSVDLRNETSTFSVFVSGFSRPVVAIFFALVVYLILDAKIVDVRFGSSSDPSAVYLVTSFLCGFSERFAQDIISRVPFAAQAGHDASAHAQR